MKSSYRLVDNEAKTIEPASQVGAIIASKLPVDTRD